MSLNAVMQWKLGRVFVWMFKFKKEKKNNFPGYYIKYVRQGLTEEVVFCKGLSTKGRKSSLVIQC